ncbi:unnamed protein product [Effrenium voratum]|uniref:Uncharacterized protein n=1 Tax=Effrenium voratum TaxID=2562239 RepID=A0AA36JP15_9DINO|nr:unnamed protein product [Effrenium voratum]
MPSCAVQVMRRERPVQRIQQPVPRSASPCSRSVWWPQPQHTASAVPIPVLAFGTPPRTPRPAPAGPLWARQIIIQSPQRVATPCRVVYSTSEDKARRHSMPQAAPELEPVQTARPVKTDVPKVASQLQEARQPLQMMPMQSKEELSASRPTQELLASARCVRKSNDSRGCLLGSQSCHWSPMVTCRLTHSAREHFTPQSSCRQIRRSEVPDRLLQSTAVKVQPVPPAPDTTQIDRIRSEMMEVLEERERYHQKQLQCMHEFQKERERDHQRQLQQMQQLHKADMQRLEEKARPPWASGDRMHKTIVEAAPAASQDEEDTLMYTEPSMDHTLSPITVREVDCSPAAASPLLSEGSFPSSAVLGSEASPLARSIKLLPPLPPQYPQVPMLPKRLQ